MINVFDVKELRNDFFISLILGIFSLLIIYKLDLEFILENLLKSAETILTVSVTLAGFLINAFTILFIFPESMKIKFIKKHSAYSYIFDAFILSIVLFISIAVICFTFMILMNHVPLFLASVLVFLLIWSFISLFRCMWLLKKIAELSFPRKETK